MIRLKKSEASVPAAEYHLALHGQYRVWMMTSAGDAAQLVEYEMDQEAIEEFFEDYTRFADLLIRIEVKESPVEAVGADEQTPAMGGANAGDTANAGTGDTPRSES